MKTLTFYYTEGGKFILNEKWPVVREKRKDESDIDYQNWHRDALQQAIKEGAEVDDQEFVLMLISFPFYDKTTAGTFQQFKDNWNNNPAFRNKYGLQNLSGFYSIEWDGEVKVEETCCNIQVHGGIQSPDCCHSHRKVARLIPSEPVKEEQFWLTPDRIMQAVKDEIMESYGSISDHYLTIGIVNEALKRITRKPQ